MALLKWTVDGTGELIYIIFPHGRKLMEINLPRAVHRSVLIMVMIILTG